MGFYLLDVPLGHADYGKAIPCTCQAEARRLKRARYLDRLDGLTERERSLTFDTISDEFEPGVLNRIRSMADARKGMLTLQGVPGTGKTTLLICAVNLARSNDHLAIYTTVTDLLSYLRATFQPDSDVQFDKYWDALIRCEVLALDEMDEFNTTPWAMERFLRLVDERWRRLDEVLTLCAVNRPLVTLPDKVQSRLHDGRGQVIKIAGRDMRPLNSWGQ